MEQRRLRQAGRAESKSIWRICLGLALFVLLLLFFLPGHGIMHYRKLQKQMDTLARENADLQQQNEDLAREIEALKHDDHKLEEVAREKGLLKKNEEVYDFNKKSSK